MYKGAGTKEREQKSWYKGDDTKEWVQKSGYNRADTKEQVQRSWYKGADTKGEVTPKGYTFVKDLKLLISCKRRYFGNSLVNETLTIHTAGYNQ